jgi:hypothetical protein
MLNSLEHDKTLTPCQDIWNNAKFSEFKTLSKKFMDGEIHSWPWACHCNFDENMQQFTPQLKEMIDLDFIPINVPLFDSKGSMRYFDDAFTYINGFCNQDTLNKFRNLGPDYFLFLTHIMVDCENGVMLVPPNGTILELQDGIYNSTPCHHHIKVAKIEKSRTKIPYLEQLMHVPKQMKDEFKARYNRFVIVIRKSPYQKNPRIFQDVLDALKGVRCSNVGCGSEVKLKNIKIEPVENGKAACKAVKRKADDMNSNEIKKMKIL